MTANNFSITSHHFLSATWRLARLHVFSSCLIALFATIPSISVAASDVASCEGAIRYDTVELRQNLAARLAVWERFDLETYKKAKNSGDAEFAIYDVPIGLSYEQFDEERSRLRRSLALQQSVNYSMNSKWQAVNADSVKGYVECLNKLSDKKFLASILYATRETVFVWIKKNENPAQINRDRVNVEYIKGGTNARRMPIVLAGSATTTLAFDRTPNSAFDVLITLSSEDGAELDSASFSLPKFANIKNRPIPVTKTSNPVTCVNTYSGDAQGRMWIVADIDEQLQVGTEKFSAEYVDGAGPGGYDNKIVSSTSRRAEMAGTCASSNNHTSINFTMSFTMQALKDNFVDEIVLTEAAAVKQRATLLRRVK